MHIKFFVSSSTFKWSSILNDSKKPLKYREMYCRYLYSRIYPVMNVDEKIFQLVSPFVDFKIL